MASRRSRNGDQRLNIADVVREQEEILQRCRADTSAPTRGKSSSWSDTERERTIQEQRELLELFSKPNSRSRSNRLSTPTLSPTRSAPAYEMPRQCQLSPSSSGPGRTDSTRSSYTIPLPPPTIHLPLSQSSEVDVDSLQIERRPSTRVKSGRLSYNHNSSQSSLDDFVVGAYNVRNAPPAPQHPSDQQSQSQRSFPRQVSRRLPSENDSTITRTLVSMEGQCPAIQTEAEVVTEEPIDYPLPATVVNPPHHPHLTMAPPPDNDTSRSEEQPQPPKTEQKSTLTYIMGGIGFVAAIAAAIILVFTYSIDIGLPFYQDKQEETQNAQNTSDVPTEDPIHTQPTQPIPTLPPTHFVLDLPSHTIDTINKDPQSPQALAYSWILDDVGLYPNRSMDQRYQRYALMTLFYATGGDEGNWRSRPGWNDHDLDECGWISSVDSSSLPSPFQLYDPSTCLLESLDLSENGLKGYIPPELSLMTNLRYINLRENELQRGPSKLCLPTELGLLTKLELFDFFYSNIHSKLCGTIPSEVGKLTSMKNLLLDKNQFSGTIPTEFGLMTNLKELMLANNKISGPLPAEFGNLLSQKLMVLDLGNNKMSGTIPTDFNDALMVRRSNDAAGFSKMKIIIQGLEQTFFGTIPDEMCRLNSRFDYKCHEERNPQEGLCGCSMCECSQEDDNPDNNYLF